jgi:DNA (cytosine-5)-methyltransferase 1
MGGGGHDVPIIKDEHGIRKLTPRECLRMQGFPDWYELPKIREVDGKKPRPFADSILYKQAGNSVSVPVIGAIAKQVVCAMGGGE